MNRLTITSRKREEMIPVTAEVQGIVSKHGWVEGMLLLHCPHTTAGITINESADPDVRADMCGHLRELVPAKPSFRHYEGNSDAHIKASLMGAQLSLIVSNGRLALGHWQEVYFCEWDGPRKRELWLQFIETRCTDG